MEHNNFKIAGFLVLKSTLVNTKVKYKKLDEDIKLEDVGVTFFSLELRLIYKETIELIEEKEVLISDNKANVQKAGDRIVSYEVTFKHIENIIQDMILSKDKLEEIYIIDSILKVNHFHQILCFEHSERNDWFYE